MQIRQLICFCGLILCFGASIDCLKKVDAKEADKEGLQEVNIVPSGWRITAPYSKEKSLIQSIKSNCTVYGYWETPLGGSEKPEFIIIGSEKSLDSLWDVLRNKKVDIEKPETDLNKKRLIVIQPGRGIVMFTYDIQLQEKTNVILINLSNKPIGKSLGIAMGINPIFVFELKNSDKKVNVQFNIDSRSSTNIPK